jgi:error-prone DNA polymerase
MGLRGAPPPLGAPRLVGHVTGVAELTVASAFSFSEGASMPEELVERAQALGFRALAITDRDGVYGLPRAWRVARGTALRLLSGARITIEGGPGMVLLARDTKGWAHLCQLLTACHKDTEKGRGRIALDAVLEKAAGLETILMGPWDAPSARAVGDAFGSCASVGIARWRDGNDETRVAAQTRLAAFTGIPLVVANDVVMHDRSRKALHDVLSAIRLHATVDQAGRALDPNAERVLRSPQELAEIYSDMPAALERTLEIADRCHFTLADLHYRYPREVVPEDTTPMAWLRTLTDRGLEWRYPLGIPDSIRTQVEHELGIIERLDFPAYFLTVYDAVRFARERGILCQGRGSAANSAVCFALGITSVDPACAALLFERFISEERGEPPDIDVDFEHERREEVIQYVYEKYGRHRAGMVNEVIAYRTRSAIRDVGKALGLSLDQVDRLAKRIQWFEEVLPEDGKPFSEKTAPVAIERLLEAGLDPNDERVQLTLRLSHELSGFPRHVGIHVGGFTISDGPLIDLVPIEPATMENRTVIQWDKDDIDVVGFVKVDMLALGMLTAIRKCFDFLKVHWARAKP